MNDGSLRARSATSRCTVKTRHVPGSKAERECEVHGVGMRPGSAAAAAAPPPASPTSTREPEVEVEHLEDGTQVEQWYLDDKLHRVDGPAWVGYHPDGTVEWEQWRLDGKLHRVDGPAVVDYHPDGTVKEEAWCQDGELHREDGPADVSCHPDGTVEWEEWYLDGNYVPRERVAAPYLTKHFEPVSEINTGAIDMLLAQGPLTELTAEQVRLALTLYPEI